MKIGKTYTVKHNAHLNGGYIVHASDGDNLAELETTIEFIHEILIPDGSALKFLGEEVIDVKFLGSTTFWNFQCGDQKVSWPSWATDQDFIQFLE